MQAKSVTARACESASNSLSLSPVLKQSSSPSNLSICLIDKSVSSKLVFGEEKLADILIHRLLLAYLVSLITLNTEM